MTSYPLNLTPTTRKKLLAIEVQWLGILFEMTKKLQRQYKFLRRKLRIFNFLIRFVQCKHYIELWFLYILCALPTTYWKITVFWKFFLL